MRLPAALLALSLCAPGAGASGSDTTAQQPPAEDPQQVGQDSVQRLQDDGVLPPPGQTDTHELQNTIGKMPKDARDQVEKILRDSTGGQAPVDPTTAQVVADLMDPNATQQRPGNGGIVQDDKGNSFWHKFKGRSQEFGPGGGGESYFPKEPRGGDGRHERHRIKNEFGSQEMRFARDLDPRPFQSVPPSNPTAYNNAQATLALRDQARGDNAAAFNRYQSVIGRGGDDPSVLTFASLSALNAGEPQKAYDWSKQALKKDPSGEMAAQAMAINKLAQNRLPRQDDIRPPLTSQDAAANPRTGGAGGAASIPELDRPLPPRPAEPGLPKEARDLLAETNRLVALAAKANRAGDTKEAVAKATEALEKDPDDVRALQVRASANAKEGRWDAVKRDADRALDLAPGYVPMLLLRAAASVHAKDWRAVRRDADEVLIKEGANPTAWRFRGIAQAGLGERADALASLERAQRHGDPEAARLLAVARSLPPGADVVDLVDMLTSGAEVRTAMESGRPEPARAPAKSSGKGRFVFLASLFAGVTVGGLILLAGWGSGRD